MADFALGDPSASLATNLDYTLSGAVRGRPSARNVNGPTEANAWGDVPTTTASLAALLAATSGSGGVPASAGIVEAAAGQPFAVWQGRGVQYIPPAAWTDLSAARWVDAGPV